MKLFKKPITEYLVLGLMASLSACAKNSVTDPASAAALKSSEIVFNYKPTSGNSEIYRSSIDGSGVVKLTSDTNYENWWPKISPDRTKILYYRGPVGTNEDYAQAVLMMMNADGSSQKILRTSAQNGWTLQAHVEWSPISSELVMCGTASGAVHLFITDLNGATKRQLTTTGGWNCDPAWSPDGSKIVFNRCAGVGCHNTFGNLDIYSLNSSDGTGLLQLTSADSKDDYDPYYSPNGSEIAWLHQVNNTGWSGAGVWSIKKMSAAGASQVFLINDTNINSKPSWTLDGSKILFHRMAPLEVVKYRLFSMASDGTNLLEIIPFGAASGAGVGQLSYPMN